MLKKRVIGVVPVREGIAVQSIGFRRYLPIGKPEIVIEYLDRWGIDEIVVVHIDAAARGTYPRAAEVASYARQCRVPLSVGGGITSSDAVTEIIQAGADKVVINAAAIADPGLIERSATLFGDQCVVVSIDARRSDGTHEVCTHGGRRSLRRTPVELAVALAPRGVGEFFLTSIDCDGMRSGYDLELIRSVAPEVDVPVIACGGAGRPEHMVEAIAAGASAVAAGNFFQYVEHSVILVKRALASRQQAVRLDSYVDYSAHRFDADGRLAKLSDEALDALRFRYVAEEVI